MSDPKSDLTGNIFYRCRVRRLLPGAAIVAVLNSLFALIPHLSRFFTFDL